MSKKPFTAVTQVRERAIMRKRAFDYRTEQHAVSMQILGDRGKFYHFQDKPSAILHGGNSNPFIY